MPPIPLISKLVSDLDSAGISYCHWKSNAAIDRVEQGDTDLDLLVAERHTAAFDDVLARNGFSPASRPHVEDPPAVAHHFGYDPEADRFVHVHAHYQLVIGHDRTKNYRLPIEEPYLASVRTDSALPVPEPEFEYVVLVIRMILKYAIWDEVLWKAVRGGKAGPTTSERAELESLRSGVDPVRVNAIVEDHLPFIGLDLFDEAAAVANDSMHIRQTLDVGRRMYAALAPHGRSPAPVDTGLRIWRRLAVSLRRRIGRSNRFHLSGGGAIVAIMGGDGAGKSTAIDEVGRWLSQDFDVYPVHLGKPPWSWTTYIVRGGLKLLTGLGIGSDVAISTDGQTTEYRRLVWYACKARDRYREYRKARRAADRGAIVLSDRFPHPGLSETDVPQIDRLAPDEGNRLLRLLAAIEKRYHTRVALPDLAFVLMLDPEEAAKRKTDEPYDYVLERSTEIWETDWSGHDVHLVDAARSPDEVAAEIKKVIWRSLT